MDDEDKGTGIGTQIAGQLAGAGIGIGTNIIGGYMQQQQQENMTDMQVQAQKELTRFNRLEGMQMWRDTNYGAQVDELKKAGLNVGMIYGKGGAGGATAQVAAGSVAGGQAQNKGADMGQAMGIGADAALKAAQIENIKANTEKTHAEKTEVEARTPTYEKDMAKTDAEIQEIATKLNVNIETAKKIIQEVEQSKAQTTQIGAQTNLTNAQTEKTGAETNRIERLTPLEAQQMEENIKSQITRNVYLDQKERIELEKMAQEIVSMQNAIRMGDDKIDIDGFKTQLEAKYPSLFNVAGGVLNQIFTYITEGRDTNYLHKPDRR